MSLIVSVISKNESFKIDERENELSYPHNELFGFESWRKELWGHEIMKSIGCYMLYSLSQKDVYAFDSDLQQLKSELHKVLEHIRIIAEVTNIDQDSIAFRVQNALTKIGIAEKYIDKVGVALW